jgi:transposase
VDRDQRFLLPPDMAEWLPPDHLVWFVLDVVEQLDTEGFHRRHPKAGPGRRAFDPDMLLALLVYSYAVGQRSSRRIEALCTDHVAFRVVCGGDPPDHCTIARFRAVHEDAFAALFTQVLVLCAQAGMGKVGTVAIDGTKIAANAAKGANRTEETLRAQAKQIMAEAAAVDAAEDEEFGDARGDELPEQFADPRGRRERIRKALEEIARQKAQAEELTAAEKQRAEDYLSALEAGQAPRGPVPRGADPVRVARAKLARSQQRHRDAENSSDGERRRTAKKDMHRFEQQLAAAKAVQDQEPSGPDTVLTRHTQRKLAKPPRVNVTDPDSRLMNASNGGSIQGYNAQIVVSDDHLILATSISQVANDYGSFAPMMAAAVEAAALLHGARAEPDQDASPEPVGIGLVLADAGYFSHENLTATGPDRLIALGKHRDTQREAHEYPTSGPPPEDATPVQRMRHRLRTPEGIAAYKRRSATVEPVNAHLKDQVGLRRFSRRGLKAATSELDLAATVVNLLKLHRHTTPATA